jgi:arylsulfatase
MQTTARHGLAVRLAAAGGSSVPAGPGNETSSAPQAAKPAKPNILLIWGDDIGTWNLSHNNRGMMGYRTPNIDRIAAEGVGFTDYYGQQSCTAGRAAFNGGCVPVRTGVSKVGMPAAAAGGP